MRKRKAVKQAELAKVELAKIEKQAPVWSFVFEPVFLFLLLNMVMQMSQASMVTCALRKRNASLLNKASSSVDFEGTKRELQSHIDSTNNTIRDLTSKLLNSKRVLQAI